MKNHGADWLTAPVLAKSRGPKFSDSHEPPTKEDIDEALASLDGKTTRIAQSTRKAVEHLSGIADSGLSGPGFVTMVHSLCRPTRTPGGRSLTPSREQVEEVLRAAFCVGEGFLR